MQVFRVNLFVSILLLSAVAFHSNPAWSRTCGSGGYREELKQWKNRGTDPDLRSEIGTCMVQFFLDRPEVAQLALKIIRNPKEDLFLREDLIDAFGATTLRRKVKIGGIPTPKLGAQEQVAVDRTIASVSDILAVTQAVKSMDEIIPVTPLENDFFRALSEIAEDNSSHVVLREHAVKALENASAEVAKSGAFDQKLVKITYDTLERLALQQDSASYYTGARLAFEGLANKGIPAFIGGLPQEKDAGRMLSSETAPLPAE